MSYRYRGHRGHRGHRGYGYPGLYSPMWGYGIYRPYLSPILW